MFGQKYVRVCGIRLAVVLFLLVGCARVRFESKEPIKVDVTMRLDIYQHVAKDAADIEDMISSGDEKKGAAAGNKSVSWLDIQEAYAQEEHERNFSPDVREAIERRKARREDLYAQESEGVLGENAQGFVVVRDPSAVDSKTAAMVEEENKDRRIIYQHVAQKNEAGLDDTGRVFAKRIQEKAPSSTPIEVMESSGSFKWTIK